MNDARDQSLSPTLLVAIRPLTEEVRCRLRGDFSCAADLANQMNQIAFIGYNYADLLTATNLAQAHDGAAARALMKRHPAWDDTTGIRVSFYTDVQMPRFFIAANLGDWSDAAHDAETVDRNTRSEASVADVRHSFVWPWLAYAWAMSGHLHAGQALVAKTALDCTRCLAMRGRIAALAGDERLATAWFERTMNSVPESPFVVADWGAMLMHTGDYDTAIVKFSQAHEKGPRFADPLEMWGEALMLKNRSDLALAKFEEANKCAPNWGRLHLKWGEALGYAGRKVEARAQYRLASTLDLSTADKAELERDRR